MSKRTVVSFFTSPDGREYVWKTTSPSWAWHPKTRWERIWFPLARKVNWLWLRATGKVRYHDGLFSWQGSHPIPKPPDQPDEGRS